MALVTGAPPGTPWGEPEPGAGGTIGKLVGGIAHDLNNVLTVVVGNLALAERHAAGNPKLLRLLDNMRLASERGTGLVADLVALSPDSPGGDGISAYQLSEAAQASSRILVVEDDPQVAELATAVLEDMGHAVDVRADAPSALALLRESGGFDLVFSDIVMPGGMTGIELAETIASAYPRLPVLLATGYSAQALSPGALRFPVLAKPYSVQELSRRVSAMLPPRG